MTHTEQKSRAELIEEIVGKFERSWFEEATAIEEMKGYEELRAEFRKRLRSSLLRISDASMDAVEVEKYKEEWKSKETPIANGAMSHWNAAITASQEKRRLFTK